MKMNRPVSVSQARSALPAIMDRVQSGEEITLTRHGLPVAVIIRPDVLRVRRGQGTIAAAELLQETIRRAGRVPRPAQGLTPRRAEELANDVRSGRSGR